ncbi:PAS domain-containing protein [Streptomyces sp. NPDC001797]|uniref:PAS domain-containing protein n=1 Tax=Streptomyces sp. NPDC001797 TaxID=3364610 RepID=UPI0036C9AA3A
MGPCGKDGGDVAEGLKSGAEHERRLSAGEPALWQQVVEQLGTALSVIDPAGRIVAVNPAAERLLQRAVRSVYGRDLHDLCHRDPGGALIPRERCPLLWALAERRSARGDDDRCLRGDGRLVPISWSATPPGGRRVRRLPGHGRVDRRDRGGPPCR